MTEIETMTRRLTDLPEGRRITSAFASGATVLAARRKGELVIVTAWPVMESHDDDYESVLCGCPLSRTAHAHYEYRTDDASAAARAYVSADAARLGKSSTHGLPSGAAVIVE